MWEKRHRSGSYRILLPELKQHAEKFHSYMRMNLSEFNNLLAVVTPWLTRRSIRTPINPEERLMLTLRFLATGKPSLAFLSVPSWCFNSLQNSGFNMLRNLQCSQNRLSSSACYRRRVDRYCSKEPLMEACPHQKTPHSGSLYYNYKGTFSTVLLAVCDADYRCIYASYGIFDRGDFKKAIENGSLHLPTDSSFPFTNGSSLPFFFVGDGAFPLSRRMMKPFPGQRLSHHKQIYNYRISRARRLIENFFGILACSYRVAQAVRDKNIQQR
uniref:DDE Tnp4 domain-containing protein n=1 Tax=Ditylenchus dipsaci TaxID=166011 RepID=A0A915DDJ9_9BILA